MSLIKSQFYISYGCSFIKGTAAFRVPWGLQAIPGALLFIGMMFLPESPRWLVSRDRSEEAFDILVEYHGEGDRDSALVAAEFAEIQATVRAEMEGSKRRWVELLQIPGNRRRTLIAACVGMFSQWSGNGLVSYYLNKVFNTIGITDTDIQLLITGILAIWNLCWAVFASFQVDRWGRRFLFLTSAAGMTLFFTLQTICSAQYALHGSDAAAHAVIAFIFLFYAFYE